MLEGTSTVFITVLPSGSSESGDWQSDGSQPAEGEGDGGFSNELSPALTVTKTLKPTTTLFITAGAPSNSQDQPEKWSENVSSEPAVTENSPATFVTDGQPASVSGDGADVSGSGGEAFTTLTIDIWGGSPSNDGVDQGSSGPTGDAADDHSEDLSHVSDDPVKTTTDPGQQASEDNSDNRGPTDQGALPTAYGDPNDSSDQEGGGYPLSTNSQDPLPGEPSPGNSVVTDTDVHWTVGRDGPSQVTVWSTHTLILDNTPNNAPEYTQSSGGSGWYTSFGPDGKPTIVVDSPNHSSEGTQGPSSVPPITSASPELSISSEIALSTNPPSDHGGEHTPDAQDSAGELPCTTFTIVGPDGKPTVIHSTWSEAGAARPTGEDTSDVWSTASDLHQHDLPEATGSVSTSDGLSPDAEGGQPAFTTCITLTVTGADGIPTAFESTIVATAVETGDQAQNDFSTIVPSIPTAPTVPPELPAITTAALITITGTDGLPTVVESTIVASAPEHSPATFGFPSVGGITTCVSYTFTGVDGLPTIADSTLVLPTAEEVSEASAALPTSIHSVSGPAEGPVSDSNGFERFTFTITGADGRPTVFETILASHPTSTASFLIPGMPGPVITGASFSGLPTEVPANLPSGAPTPTAGNSWPGEQGGITTCTTLTYFGPDGLPTVIESTWVASASGNSNVGYPSSVAGSSQFVPVSGLPTPIPIPYPSGLPSSIAPGLPPGGHEVGITTCTSYTILGSDGLPTVVDSTWVVPNPLSTAADASQPSLSGQPTGLPSLPSQDDLADDNVSTTCSSYTVLGADGLPTVVETTWTVLAQPAATEPTLGFPTALPPVAGLPSGIVPSPLDNGFVTSSYTIVNIGPDGLPTPVVQTVVMTPGAISTIAGVPLEPTPGPSVGGSSPGQPGLSGYGGDLSQLQTILPPVASQPSPVLSDGRVLPGDGGLPPFISGTVTGTQTSTLTVTALPGGGPVVIGEPGAPPSYDDSLGDSAQLPGQAQPYETSVNGLSTDQTLWPSPVVYGSPQPATLPPAVSSPCTTLRTSTWTNLIAEQTTTYTLKYPLTTLATITTPGVPVNVARHARRWEK